MVVSAHSYQSTFDAWHGILNMPSKFEVVELLQTGVVGQIEMGT
jgi:hypothetical protein